MGLNCISLPLRKVTNHRCKEATKIPSWEGQTEWSHQSPRATRHNQDNTWYRSLKVTMGNKTEKQKSRTGKEIW